MFTPSQGIEHHDAVKMRVAVEQQRVTLLHDPVNLRLRERLRQRCRGGQRVDDVADRAETNNQESLRRIRHPSHLKKLWRRRRRRYSPRARREISARSSRVEWFLGSPTIRTSPPKLFTTSRSGTVSSE